MKKQQSGFVLLAALGLTLVISIIVVSAVNRAGSQQTMAASMKDKELSFQAAESVLRDAETFLVNSSEEALFGLFDDTNGYYSYDGGRDFLSDASWGDPQSSDKMYNIAESQSYIIEELPEILETDDSLAIPRTIDSRYYRVTAKSVGGTENASTVLQTVYKK